MARRTTWRFTVVSGPAERLVVTYEVRNDADVLAMLTKLKAPERVLGFVRHHGSSAARKLSWQCRGATVAGVRV